MPARRRRRGAGVRGRHAGSLGIRPALLWLELCAPRETRSDLIGDLLELRGRRRSRLSTSGTRLAGLRSAAWLWREAALLGVALLAERVRERRATRGARDHRTFAAFNPSPDNGPDMLDRIRHDLRGALRALRAAPGHTLACIAILTLGLGALTAIQSVVHGVLLHPLPYDEADRLVAVWGEYTAEGIERAPITAWDVDQLRGRVGTLENAAGLFQGSATLTGDGAAEEIGFGWISPELLPTLRVEPLLGRNFTSDDVGQLLVLLEHDFWRRRFGADPGIVGRTLTIAQQSWEVLGVLPPDRPLLLPSRGRLPSRADAWSLVGIPSEAPDKRAGWLRAVGRLRRGATLTQLQAELDALAAADREIDAQRADVGFEYTAAPLLEDFTAGVRPVLGILFGGAALLLAVTVANVGGLLLLRGEARRNELAVRVALGGSRARIFRQLLVESLLLGALGFAGALAFASAALRALPGMTLPQLPRLDGVALDPAVIGLSVGITLLSATAFGMLPALRGSKGSPGSALQTTRGSSTVSSRAGGALVGVEMALALVLLIAGGLLAGTVYNVARLEPGFEPTGALTLRIALPFADLFAAREEVAAMVTDLEQSLDAVAGVERAGMTHLLPLAGGLATGPFAGDRAEGLDDGDAPQADYRFVSAGYLPALGARLVAGRFPRADGPADAVVIDSVLADSLWPGESALEQRFGAQPFGAAGWQRVVGVIEHVRHESVVEDGRPTIYFPLRHHPRGYLTVVLRTEGDPQALVGPARAAIDAVDAEIPVSRVLPLDEVVRQSTSVLRAATVLVSAFAAIAAVLVCAGLYALLAFAVRRRSPEIGLRIALGAGGRDIARWLVASAMLSLLGGLGLGAVGALGATRLLTGLLYGVSPLEPAVWTGCVAVLMLVSALATAMPARRAVRVDPARTLRTE